MKFSGITYINKVVHQISEIFILRNWNSVAIEKQFPISSAFVPWQLSFLSISLITLGNS